MQNGLSPEWAAVDQRTRHDGKVDALFADCLLHGCENDVSGPIQSDRCRVLFDKKCQIEIAASQIIANTTAVEEQFGVLARNERIKRGNDSLFFLVC